MAESQQQKLSPQFSLNVALPVFLTIIAGIYVIYLWLCSIWPSIAAYWNEHWGLIVLIGIVVLLGATCHKWVPLGWSAFKALSDHGEQKKDREAYRLLLAEATVKLQQGFNTKYANAKTGDTLEVINPYVVGRVQKVQEVAAVQEVAQIAEAMPVAPPYREVDPLITSNRLVLCYTVAGAVFGTIADLLSMCVVGKPGRGKSTALLYYILVLLKAGAEVWIWDPHSGLNELSYGLRYFDDLADIERSCLPLHKELEERRQLWKEKKQTKHPLLLLVDEMPVIADYENQRAKEVATAVKVAKQEGPDAAAEAMEDAKEFDLWRRPSRLLKKFVLEARKWNCYVILSGQALPAEVLSTLTRDNLSSRIVFESCNMHAKMAGLQKEEIDRLLPMLRGAGPGKAVMDVSRWSKPVLAAIPQTTVDDLREYIDGRGNNDFYGAATVELEQWTTSQHETVYHRRNTDELEFPGVSTSTETALQADGDGDKQTDVNTSQEEPESGEIDTSDPVYAEKRETIKRLNDLKISHRKIAKVVRLDGRKYVIYKKLCSELGIVVSGE